MEKTKSPMVSTMMRQYHDAKAKNPAMLLCFRVGDFYEFFSEDARTVAKQLKLTLTSRDNGQLPMCGFPHHQLDEYLAALLVAGHRVALLEAA